MTYVKSLRCVECGREYKIEPIYVCEFCFGPLEVTYDYERIKRDMTRQAVESRPHTMWRYRELLPIDGDPVTGSRLGLHSPDEGAEPCARMGRQGNLPQGRLREPPDPVLQGPCRGRGRHQGQGVRLRHRGLRVDGQPGQFRGCPGSAGRHEALYFHALGPGAFEDHQLRLSTFRTW